MTQEGEEGVVLGHGRVEACRRTQAGLLNREKQQPGAYRRHGPEHEIKGQIKQIDDQWNETNKAVSEANSTCEASVRVCVCLYDGVWLQAWTQQKVGTGESNQAPQGVQEDLNSSIITESQAVAMSPDCWVPVELSLFLSLLLALSFFLFLSPPSL